MIAAKFGANRTPEDAVVATARAIVALHTPTQEGFCAGCLGQWARLAPAMCEPLRWATDVIHAHEVTPAASVAGVGFEASRTEEARTGVR